MTKQKEDTQYIILGDDFETITTSKRVMTYTEALKGAENLVLNDDSLMVLIAKIETTVVRPNNAIVRPFEFTEEKTK